MYDTLLGYPYPIQFSELPPREFEGALPPREFSFSPVPDSFYANKIVHLGGPHEWIDELHFRLREEVLINGDLFRVVSVAACDDGMMEIGFQRT